MDSEGNLRSITAEELFTMEDLLHPVDSTADIPEWKRKMFERVDKQGNRAARKKFAKANKVVWQEYQIYKTLKRKETHNEN